MDGLNQKQWYYIFGNFVSANWRRGKKFTIHHFEKMRILRKTIYQINERWGQGLPMERKVGTGGILTKMTWRVITRLVKVALLKTGMYQCRLAQKIGVSP